MPETGQVEEKQHAEECQADPGKGASGLTRCGFMQRSGERDAQSDRLQLNDSEHTIPFWVCPLFPVFSN